MRHEIIFVRNPPVKEIVDYKRARDACQALQNAQASDVASEQYLQSNITAKATSLWATSATNAVPNNNNINNNNTYNSQNIYNQALNLEYSSASAITNLNAAHARTQARDAQIAPLQKYLSTFPDPNVYWLDHFAMRTGKKIDGIEVYDLGAAEGLTY
jgi:hypothetical protein